MLHRFNEQVDNHVTLDNQDAQMMRAYYNAVASRPLGYPDNDCSGRLVNKAFRGFDKVNMFLKSVLPALPPDHTPAIKRPERLIASPKDLPQIFAEYPTIWLWPRYSAHP